MWVGVCVSSVALFSEKQKAGRKTKKKLIIFIIAQKFILFARAVNIFDSDFQMAKKASQDPATPSSLSFFGRNCSEFQMTLARPEAY